MTAILARAAVDMATGRKRGETKGEREQRGGGPKKRVTGVRSSSGKCVTMVVCMLCCCSTQRSWYVAASSCVCVFVSRPVWSAACPVVWTYVRAVRRVVAMLCAATTNLACPARSDRVGWTNEVRQPTTRCHCHRAQHSRPAQASQQPQQRESGWTMCAMSTQTHSHTAADYLPVSASYTPSVLVGHWAAEACATMNSDTAQVTCSSICHLTCRR